MKMGQSGRPQGGNLGEAGADRQIDSARKLAMGAPSKSELIDEPIGSECEVEYIISEKFQLSWNHPLGAKVLGQRIIERLPDLSGCRFITFTLNQKQFESPLKGFMDGGDKIRKVFHALRDGVEWNGIVYQVDEPYCRKLELHQNGWPHWHCILKSKKFIPENLLRKLWGYGIVDVESIKSKEFHYLLKYLVKDPTSELPDWYKSLKKTRPFVSTRGFLTPIPEKPKRISQKKKNKKQKRASYTVEERLNLWAHQGTLKSSVAKETKTRTVLLDFPYRKLAFDHLLEFAGKGQYLGDLKFKMNSNEELLSWMSPKK